MVWSSRPSIFFLLLLLWSLGVVAHCGGAFLGVSCDPCLTYWRTPWRSIMLLNVLPGLLMASLILLYLGSQQVARAGTDSDTAGSKKSFEKQIEDLGFIPTIYSPAQELVDMNLVQECRLKKIKLMD